MNKKVEYTNKITLEKAAALLDTTHDRFVRAFGFSKEDKFEYHVNDIAKAVRCDARQFYAVYRGYDRIVKRQYLLDMYELSVQQYRKVYFPIFCKIGKWENRFSVATCGRHYAAYKSKWNRSVHYFYPHKIRRIDDE